MEYVVYEFKNDELDNTRLMESAMTEREIQLLKKENEILKRERAVIDAEFKALGISPVQTDSETRKYTDSELADMIVGPFEIKEADQTPKLNGRDFSNRSEEDKLGDLIVGDFELE